MVVTPKITSAIVAITYNVRERTGTKRDITLMMIIATVKPTVALRNVLMVSVSLMVLDINVRTAETLVKIIVNRKMIARILELP